MENNPLVAAQGVEASLALRATWLETVWPAELSTAATSGASPLYLSEPATRKMLEFFERKGMRAIKQEDQQEKWYDDWIAYQAEHGLYASVLSPKQYSSAGRQFDLLRYARFFETLSFSSPSHAYSLQVSFLGLFSILMGSCESVKQEAVASLERGGQFAFGVSEKQHGSDLLGNEFILRDVAPGKFIANGSKYYIGNANCASIICALARIEKNERASRRPHLVLFALRPKSTTAFTHLRKIRTLGVRAAFVGAFDVKDHEVAGTDIVADGRTAWDAVMGTVTLGKFFLGFGSIGVCEHASSEASAHLKQRILYGKPVIAMPHIRTAAAQSCARLMAVKLFAYRALDYVHAASPQDRRYLLYCAVQKAKVSTEGVKVMSLLSQCVGAKGFEAEDTFFEMALRDAQLIPLLESSAHINLNFTAQFITRYFSRDDASLVSPRSLTAGSVAATENSYLMSARSGAINSISFPPYRAAYRPLLAIANVRLFAMQASLFHRIARNVQEQCEAQTELSMALGQCLATIVYGQLIAENAILLGVPSEVISAIFHLLVTDLSEAALALASTQGASEKSKSRLRRMIMIPKTKPGDWEFVADRM